jgi:hypothetical protein
MKLTVLVLLILDSASQLQKLHKTSYSKEFNVATGPHHYFSMLIVNVETLMNLWELEVLILMLTLLVKHYTLVIKNVKKTINVKVSPSL